MNKSAIQKFAIWARNELITQVSQRAYQYGIDESGFGDASADAINGRLLSIEEKSQRQELINQIKDKGYKQVMEEVAYTWFNRFIALRFMEVNNYLPSHIRVFSDASGAFKPEILNNVLHLDLPELDRDKVKKYIDNSDPEALYRYLLLTQCNALNTSLPVMFERMGSYTEMLLPNNILRQDSIIGHMVYDIPEEDWQNAVQIIGWLYQYYNTELKNDTFAQLKKNVKITKERIPAATQLFTPEWIVRYMVENSLGRLWLEGHPNAELHDSWKYYLDEAEQEPEVEEQLVKIRDVYKTINPEEIKVIDPCMGKTTLANLVNRFWDVDRGEITLGDVNIKDYDLENLMSQISMVFQRVYLFRDTIEANIKFGNPEAEIQDIKEAAINAKCDHFISKLEDGYNTIIGEGGADLSGGERQRISIARAILKNAPIIILDEATANIDPENERDINTAIKNLTQDKTVIVIAHRLKTVKEADQIVVLNRGEIEQIGKHSELIQEEGLYKNFVRNIEKAKNWKI